MIDFILRLKLSQDMTIDKLNEITGDDSLVFPAYRSSNRTKKLIGRITGQSVRLMLKQQNRNSFKAVLYARVSEIGENESSLSGTFSTLPFVAGFLRLWIGFAILMAVVSTVTAVTLLLNKKTFNSEYAFLLIPFVLVAFGFILKKAGKEIFIKETIKMEKTLREHFRDYIHD